MRLRIKDKHTGSEQVFSITSNEDFTPIIMTYPDVREVVFYQYEQRGYGDYYKHFRGLVDAVAEHLNKIHGVEATVEADNIFEYKNPQDPFEKSAKKKLYHITDNPNFALDPNFAPEDNSVSIISREGRKGIYLAPSVETWVNSHGYARPFVAEFEIDENDLKHPEVGGRWGGEKFIPNHLYDKLKLNRVIPIDAHTREVYGSPGWFEEAKGKEFDSQKPIKPVMSRDEIYPFKGYKYHGDVRNLHPNEQQSLINHFNEGYKKYYNIQDEPEDDFDKAELEKGQNGDWEKEGYKINVRKLQPEDYEYEYREYYQNHPEELSASITATHPVHGEVGYTQVSGKGENYKVHKVLVHPDHRRKGLATAMYSAAESFLGHPISPETDSESQSKDAKALWDNPNRKFGKNELEKGQNGDWEKEGYKLSHWVDKHGHHNVSATAPDGTMAGYASFGSHLVPNKEKTFLVSHPDYMTGWSLEVHPKHQRKGLASAMYEFAEKQSGRKILRGGTTPDGSKFWENPNRKFGKNELEKGLNGDWQKEGYKISHKFHDPTLLSVYSHDSKGNKIGETILHHDSNKKRLFPDHIDVDKAHRRKGVASAMYSYAEKLTGATLHHNPEEQTDEVKALWADPNRKFGKNEKAKLALIAASLAFTPINLQPATLTKAISPDVFKYRPYGHKPEDRFLQAIMQLESTGGKNLNHPEKNCIGRWGLMLNTIKDMVKIFDHKNADTQLILSMNGDELKKLFKKRPELELHIARIMARFVLAKFNGDLDRSAYAWKYGQNSQPTKDDLENSDYVRKFRFFTGNISKSEPEKFEDKFKKWVLKREQDKQDNELAIPSIAYASTDKQKLPKLTTSYDRLINNIEQSN